MDQHHFTKSAVWRSGGIDFSLTAGLDQISVDAIEDGDLIFCARPGPLQLLSACAKDCFRHVGMCVRHDGEPHIVEVSGDFFGSRPVSDIVHKYPQIAVARMDVDATCRQGAAHWCDAHLETPNVYAWPDLILAGLIAATKHRLAIVDRQLLERVLAAAAAKAAERDQQRSGVSLTCSAFIHRAYREAGDACSLAILPLRRARSATAGEPRPVDLTLEEVLALPAAHRDRLLAGASLFEMASGFADRDRITSHTRISSGQLADLVVTIVHGIAGAKVTASELNQSDDSRWITPGDLWRSATVSGRFRLESRHSGVSRTSPDH